MARYVDAFVLPVPKKNLAAYRRLAVLGSKVWRKHGALEYRECVADELKVPFGVSFTRLLRLKRGETAFFSWIVYRSKADRARVNAKAMSDPALADCMDPKKMPFDMKRMTSGAFRFFVAK